MTNEEAREILKRVEIAKPIKFEDYADMREALELAIKALEVTEQVNSSHNGVQMFPKGAFKSIYNESEDEE